MSTMTITERKEIESTLERARFVLINNELHDRSSCVCTSGSLLVPFSSLAWSIVLGPNKVEVSRCCGLSLRRRRRRLARDIPGARDIPHEHAHTRCSFGQWLIVVAVVAQQCAVAGQRAPMANGDAANKWPMTKADLRGGNGGNYLRCECARERTGVSVAAGLAAIAGQALTGRVSVCPENTQRNIFASQRQNSLASQQPISRRAR